MKTLLTLTISGSVLTLLLLGLRYAAARRMPSTVYYYAWIFVLLRFVLPLPGLVPVGTESEPSLSTVVSYSETDIDPPSEQTAKLFTPAHEPAVIPDTQSLPKPEEPIPQSEPVLTEKPTFTMDWRSERLWLTVWAVGAALCFGLTVVSYLRFVIPLRMELRRPERTIGRIYHSLPGRKPALAVADTIRTPMMFGLVSPRIVLPERQYDKEMLLNILRHELMHYRRFDTLYKWIAEIVLSLHWFNPLGWVIRRELSRACELSCDEMLLRSMTREEKHSYGHTLLLMASAAALPNRVVATTFSTEKRNLKERLEQIMNFKNKKGRLAAGVLALALLAGCGLAAGPQAEKTEESPILPDDAVHVTNVDEFLAAIEPNATIYLEEGEYVLSAASDYGRESSNFNYHWEPVWNELGEPSAELVIRGADNLTICGAGMEQTIIAAVPRHANVIRFVGCRHLNVSNLTAGHTTEPGFCSGGVFRLEDCENVVVDTCGLYGCGTVGVDAENTTALTVIGCSIYECSTNAVSLRQCANAMIEDSEIFRHGLREGDTFAVGLISAYDSNGVTIYRNRIHDNMAAFLLQLQNTQNAFFLSNEIRSNDFGTSVFHFQQYGATVDGCTFTDNHFLGWVMSNGIYANDVNGKLLEAEDFENMTLRFTDQLPTAAPPMPLHPTTEVRPGGELTVTNVDEFLSAIGPDRTIVLDGELFDLSEASSYGSIGGEYYYWRQSFDGPELVIHDVKGLTIHPSADDPQATTLSAVPRYANVLNFQNCEDLMLGSFTAGHTKEPGSCAGGVLHFQDCRNVRLEGMRLFGCGVLGIQASGCSHMNIQRTEIYECSQGAAEFFRCGELRFEDCDIHDVPSPAFVFRECNEISWNQEPISGKHDLYTVNTDGLISAYIEDYETLP